MFRISNYMVVARQKMAFVWGKLKLCRNFKEDTMTYQSLDLCIEQNTVTENYVKLNELVESLLPVNPDCNLCYYVRRELRHIWQYQLAGIFMLLIEMQKRVDIYVYPIELLARYPYISYLTGLFKINPLHYQYDWEIIAHNLKNSTVPETYSIVIDADDVSKTDDIINLFNVKNSRSDSEKYVRLWQPLNHFVVWYEYDVEDEEYLDEADFEDFEDFDETDDNKLTLDLWAALNSDIKWDEWLLNAGIFDVRNCDEWMNKLNNAKSIKQVYRIVSDYQTGHFSPAEQVLITILLAYMFDTPRIKIQYMDDNLSGVVQGLPNFLDDNLI